MLWGRNPERNCTQKQAFIWVTPDSDADKRFNVYVHLCSQEIYSSFNMVYLDNVCNCSLIKIKHNTPYWYLAKKTPQKPVNSSLSVLLDQPWTLYLLLIQPHQ